jgi:hypothetical protein
MIRKNSQKHKCVKKKERKVSSRILCFDFLPHFPPLSFHWRK